MNSDFPKSERPTAFDWIHTFSVRFLHHISIPVNPRTERYNRLYRRKKRRRQINWNE